MKYICGFCNKEKVQEILKRGKIAKCDKCGRYLPVMEDTMKLEDLFPGFNK